MITIIEDKLFKSTYSLKYITGWDNNFLRGNYTGILFFYKGDPRYVVDIFIAGNAYNLTTEDIIITIGNLHNAEDVKQIIRANEQEILEVCKTSFTMSLVYDLKNKKILTREDFDSPFPGHGLNSLFVFENISTAGGCFCLVNPTRNIKDSEFFAWFISYIYSTFICLTPRDKVEPFAKEFWQALTQLVIHGGNKKVVTISNSQSVLDCGLGDLGEVLLPTPGVTTRFEHLIESAMKQSKNRK